LKNKFRPEFDSQLDSLRFRFVREFSDGIGLFQQRASSLVRLGVPILTQAQINRFGRRKQDAPTPDFYQKGNDRSQEAADRVRIKCPRFCERPASLAVVNDLKEIRKPNCAKSPNRPK
jgi:hypothetical protein